MERNLLKLEKKKFDLLVVGGGIYGVCTAWDAALRGLSVALIEKDDFGSATSSNSLKIIHGGLRYLQHADLKRMRESTAERRMLMRIAPHFVHPLPCLMPTYGHGLKGREVMALALFLNDLICFDRNGLSDPQKHIPRGRVISKDECKKLIPGVDEQGLSGGALWYDCQVHNPERLLTSILRSAVEAGAEAANYLEMVGFKKRNDRITGVLVKDGIGRAELEIDAGLVVNTTGPWLKNLLSLLNGRLKKPRVKHSAAMNLVVKRQLIPKYAVGIWSKAKFKDEDAIMSKGSRLFFIAPWRNYSLIGTTHVHFEGETDQFKIREQDVVSFIDEVNDAYPAANISREDISFFYGGLLPADDIGDPESDVKLLKSYQIIDHELTDGLKGLISVVGVKYTTARYVAQKTVDHVAKKLGKSLPKCSTSTTQVFGGDIEVFAEFMSAEKSKRDRGLSEDAIEHLVYNYGSEYERVLSYANESSEWVEPVDSTAEVLKAEVIHAIREEMAQKLSDVIRRRTELGTAGVPSDRALHCCATLMAGELHWDSNRIQREIDETKAIYSPAL